MLFSVQCCVMGENPKTEIHEIAVGPDEARQRLDRLLSQKVEGHSRMRIKALIEKSLLTFSAWDFYDPINQRKRLIPVHRQKPRSHCQRPLQRPT